MDESNLPLKNKNKKFEIGKNIAEVLTLLL